MPKVIQNPIGIRLEVERIGNSWSLVSSASYGLGATEYPEFNVRKGMEVVLTPAQETSIRNFAKDVVYPQILANEGMTP